MEASIAAAVAIAKEKELIVLREKEKEKEKEREREGEMEAALYSNCLLLGLDAAVLGNNVGARVGLFKHSNPRVGEALLHFLLCALRGPSLSAKGENNSDVNLFGTGRTRDGTRVPAMLQKMWSPGIILELVAELNPKTYEDQIRLDFAGVWPIFDAAQSRDFRKIVQNLINELEAQGALPRSNSRVSSLATCCGQRFVELLWQLSAHALREVHKRNFPADVAASPLPASLTEVVSQNSHAASLLPVTKARIALERRRFLEGATTAVRRQALWANLANDLTAEFRALCAEEAYLHQELDKMHELQDSKARTYEGAMADDATLSVETGTELWDSLLQHTEQHEKLGSGPVEDLIAHREHRYRIDGSALRTAIDRGSNVLPTDGISEDSNHRSRLEDDVLHRPSSRDGSRLDSSPISSEGYAAEESRGRVDDKSNKAMAQLDVAEILRRWTHALNRLHKQALRLAKANDGAGPELLKDATAVADSGHSLSLHATLVEHKQHLANMQALVRQLKDSIPGMEAAVAALREQVNITDAVTACGAAQSSLPTSPFPLGIPSSQKDGQDTDDLNARDPPPLELVPPSPALKLPQLLSTSPTSMDKVTRLQKRFNQFAMVNPLEALREEDTLMDSSVAGSSVTEDGSDAGDESIMSLRQAVREAALSQPNPSQEMSIDRYGFPATEHYFTPIGQSNSNKIFEDKKVDVVFGKQRKPAGAAVRSMSVQPSVDNLWKTTEDLKRSIKPDVLKDSSLLKIERPASPPLMMDHLIFDDPYDDLLAPMSELDMLH